MAKHRKTVKRALSTRLAFVVIGSSVALIATESGLSQAHSEPVAVSEDHPKFDCATMGNRECGPGNAQGVAAGCYDAAGVLVVAWPCRIDANPDGTTDIYSGTPDH